MPRVETQEAEFMDWHDHTHQAEPSLNTETHIIIIYELKIIFA